MADSKTEKRSKVGRGLTVQFAADKKKIIKNKPTVINFNTLRRLKDANPLVNICVEMLKKTVVKIPFSVHKKDNSSVQGFEDEINYAMYIFENPNPQETYRTFWLKVLEDVLVIDRGATEHVYNGKGELMQNWAVDGATIKPCFDEYGLYAEPAFMQFLNQYKTEADRAAEFTEDEMTILINSPRTELGMEGYGISAVEQIIQTVITSLSAENFNAGTFTKQTLPPYMVNVEGATEKQITEIKNQWESQEAGNLWKGLFMNGKNVTIQKLRESNQEMQYYELTLWLARVIIAAFGLSPQDLGLTMDVNKATGEVQEHISKNQGIRDLLDLMAEWHNKVLRLLAETEPKFNELVFEFDDLDKLDERTQAEIDKMYVEIGKVLPDELRARDGQTSLDEARKTYNVAATPMAIQNPLLVKSEEDRYKSWY